MQLPLIYEHFNVESMLGESVIDALVMPPNEQIQALYRLARLGNMGYQSKAILNFAKRYYLDETETSLDHDTSTLDRK